MSDNVEKIANELRGLGIETSFLDSPRGKIVVFPYMIDVGSHKDECVQIGLSMHGNELYPEYPPHWIHISPAIDDQRGGAVEAYTDSHGCDWITLSRPPGDLWDNLATKHISHFLSDHLRRFWNDI